MNRSATTLYATTAAGCLGTLALQPGPSPFHENVAMTIAFFGGAALYASWLAVGAWKSRPVFGREAVPIGRHLPMLVHSGCGVVVAAWLLCVALGGTADSAPRGLGDAVIATAMIAVLFGWLPGVLLLGASRASGLLTGAGAFGVLWFAAMVALWG